jgi:hypothetical protein
MSLKMLGAANSLGTAVKYDRVARTFRKICENFKAVCKEAT